MLQRTYDWILSFANHPYAVWILGVVSFAESSFFLIKIFLLFQFYLLSRKIKKYYIRCRHKWN